MVSPPSFQRIGAPGRTSPSSSTVNSEYQAGQPATSLRTAQTAGPEASMVTLATENALAWPGRSQEHCSPFVSLLCYDGAVNASRTARERVRAELTREITD